MLPSSFKRTATGFGFDHQGCEPAMGRRETCGESAGPGADNHNIPIGEIVEVKVRVQLGYFEIGHGALSDAKHTCC